VAFMQYIPRVLLQLYARGPSERVLYIILGGWRDTHSDLYHSDNIVTNVYAEK